MTEQVVESIQFEIFMAGDYAQAKQVCREYCRKGFCVTIEPCDYVYTGGEETGFRVGVRNYPRFPSSEESLRDNAFWLADALRERLCQHSYMVVGPKDTWWNTTRQP